ncbi:nitroreductase/quinone reductase family protein [Nocardia sp. NPDC046763]|uniref:nitroreductase/quinone reductase family protein n=1 Tax=Nocardia sp. NPDC046763 TaxID=3155256 RepID=UPI00340360D6
MPTFVDHAKNFFPSLIIRSPFHSLMSAKYGILTFTGRKSGRIYSTPMAYVREGNRVLLSTDSPWHRNLTGGAPVTLLLRGRTVQGVATPVSDPAEGAAILRTLVDAIPSYAGPAELATENGRVPDAEIARAVTTGGRVSIAVELGAGQ